MTGPPDRGTHTQVYAGPGDDRVVVAISRGRIMLSLEDGDDRAVVAHTSRRVRVYASLGRGEDVYRGGSGRDTVVAADAPPGTSSGPVVEERDRIRTGPGPDKVYVGAFLQTTHDVVELGGGDDVLGVNGVLGPDVRPEAGAGVDLLRLVPDQCWATGSDPRCANPPSAWDWVVDNAEEVATVDGTEHGRWSAFEAFDLDRLTWEGTVDFVGGPGDEMLRASAGLAGASMGGGDDSLRLAGVPVRQRREIAAGPGHDVIFVAGWRLTLDMSTGLMWDEPRHSDGGPDTRFAGFEDAGGSGEDYATIIGDEGDNDLLAYGCFAEARGGAGDDLLRTVPDSRMMDCDYYHPGVDFDGGPGADELLGGWGNDRLDGGEGDDVADGGRGTDTCLAEVRRACEE
ncbi:hypothetical protein [Nocardioides sp.]|uniref:hypothetical protein n=1 Tax=Nocardioides sp. TaxID=35761 RepID=UPI0025FB83B6|nr:hypothetical protein [Nocardioides sp.]